MNAWIYKGQPVFIPLAGATPAVSVVEELDGPLGADEQPGPVDSVTLEPDGKIRVRRKRKLKDKRAKALEDLDAANNMADIKRALKELL